MLQAGREESVSCKTSVASLAMLHWVGEHLCGGNLADARAHLATAIPAMKRYLDGWRAHVQALFPLLDGVEHFFGVGRGPSMAAAGLGSMIQKEAAHVHGEGMGCAAFRHGPFEMIAHNVFVLVFEGAGGTRELNRRLVEDVRAGGGRAGFCGVHGDSPFAFPLVADCAIPILELLPPQMISLAFAALRAREPGKFDRLTKVTTIE
jgi:fructoselysine-6-P-deglycase FrlB-like protein